MLANGLEKVELKLHLKETNVSFPQELSEWEQKERSVKVDIMANENAAAMFCLASPRRCTVDSRATDRETFATQ